MDTVFLLLLGISILCIPVFIILAIINLILRRPAQKRFAFAGISALVFVISIIGFALTSDDPAPDQPTSVINEAPVAAEEPAISEPVDIAAEQPQPAPEPVNTSEDTLSAADEPEPAPGNTIDFDVTFSDTYRNDVTGNWRLARIAEDINIEEYAVDYYKSYFKSDSEIHIIINFTLNTTSCVTVMGNLLDVTTTDYVDKEEHDAKVACSGTLLSEYHVNIDTGEIEKIQ